MCNFSLEHKDILTMTGSNTSASEPEPKASSSTETLDLAGDLDLEARLTLTESRIDSKTGEPIKPAHGPSTLAADDPESALIFPCGSISFNDGFQIQETGARLGRL